MRGEDEGDRGKEGRGGGISQLHDRDVDDTR